MCKSFLFRRKCFIIEGKENRGEDCCTPYKSNSSMGVGGKTTKLFNRFTYLWCILFNELNKNV